MPHAKLSHTPVGYNNENAFNAKQKTTSCSTSFCDKLTVAQLLNETIIIHYI